jgi:hypothetical protein
MHHRSNTTPWLALRTAFAELPNNPTLLLAALAATILAASMSLAPPPPERPPFRDVHPLVGPDAVFRAPRPSITASDWQGQR